MSATVTVTQTAPAPTAQPAPAPEASPGKMATRRGQTVDMRTFFDRIARKLNITKESELRDLLQDLTDAMTTRVGGELLRLMDDVGRHQARPEDVRTTFNIMFVGQPEVQAELSAAIDDALGQFHQYNAKADAH